MRFDNKGFEVNVQQSLQTLDKLKGSMNFGKQERELSSLESAFRNFDLSTFGENVQKIADHFTFFGRIGDQVIRRLADGFMNLTGQITNTIKSMTLDQVSQGWDKYEQKTASVQTIMNATGKSIDEVNGYLDRLMWFSDETSFSFNEMTSALGQMTSSGGDIDKLVPMITGIANATAFAGKGSAEFQSTIRNLAQSYQAGHLQALDMKSLNIMGTSSKQLKKTFIEVGEELGKIEKGAVTLENFDTTLADKWADTEVMEKALGRFSELSEAAYEAVRNGEYDTASEAIEALSEKYDDLAVKAFKSSQEAKSFKEAIDATKDAVSSGWMDTFELIFGNYEEAKVLWTNMANSFWDIFASGAKSRNELLDEWHNFEVGGYADFTDSINYLLEAIVEAKEALSDIVHEILPELDSSHLHDATIAFKQFSLNAKEFFKGISGQKEENPLAFLEKKKGPKRPEEELMEADKALGNIQASYKKASTAGEKFYTIFRGIVSLVDLSRKRFLTLMNSLSPILGVVKSIGKMIVTISLPIAEFLTKLNSVTEVTDGFKDKIAGACDFISKKVEIFGEKVAHFLEVVLFGAIKDGKFTFESFAKSFASFFTDVSKIKENKNIKNLLDTFKGIKDFLVGSVEAVWEFVKAIPKMAPNFLPSVLSLLSSLLGIILNVTGAIGRLFSKIREWAHSGGLLPKIIGAIQIGIKKIGEFLSPVIEKAKEFFGMLSAGNFEGLKNLVDVVFKGGLLASILTLTKSGKGLLGSGAGTLESIGGVFDGITGLLSRVKSQGDVADQIKNIAIAIGILAVSLLIISSLDTNALTNGIFALGMLFTELSGFMLTLKSMSGDKGKGLSFTKKLSKTLVNIATSMVIFALALKIIATIKPEDLTKSIIGLGTILAEISGFMWALKAIAGKDGLGGIKKIGSMMKSIAVSIVILSAAMKIIATMSWEDIGKGAAVIGGFLAIISIFTLIVSALQKGFGKVSFMSIGVSILLISDALVILSGAIAIISLLSWEGIAKAGAAIGGFLLILSAFAAFSKANISGLLAGASALILIMPALVLLTGVIAGLGVLKGEMIGRALIALGGALIILAAGLMAMKRSIAGSGALLIAAAAIAVLAPALVILGAIPLKNIGKALLILAGTFAVLGISALVLGPITPVILSLSVALLAFGAAVALAGIGFTLLGTGFAIISTSALVGAKALVGAIKTIIEGIGEIGASIVKMVATVIKSVCQGIIDSLPTVLKTLWFVVSGILEWLDEHIEEIVTKIVSVLSRAIKGLREGIKGPDGFISQLFGLLVDIIKSVADWLNDEKNRDELIDAISNLIDAVVNTCFEFAAKLAEKIPFVGGIIADALRGVKAIFTGEDLTGTALDPYYNPNTGREMILSEDGTWKEVELPSDINKVSTVKYDLADEVDPNDFDKLYLAYTLTGGDFADSELNQQTPLIDFANDEELTKKNLEAFRNMSNEERAAWISDLEDMYSSTSSELKEDRSRLSQLITLLEGMQDITVYTPAPEELDAEHWQRLEELNNNSYVEPIVLDLQGSIFDGMDAIEAAKKIGEIYGTNGGEAALSAFKEYISDFGLSWSEGLEYIAPSIREKLRSAGSDAANQYVAGAILGLKNKENSLREAAMSVANAGIIKPFKNTLQIASPSKVAIGLGRFWDLGLADGLYSSYPSILKATNNNANGMISTMSYAASEMLDRFNSAYNDINNLGPITPVTSFGDLSAMEHLSSVMSNQNRRAYGLRSKKSENVTDSASSYTTKNYGGFTINVTAPEGKDPSEWAHYVMDEIQSEIERREAALA